MATKFFNNIAGETLFEKIKGIAQGMGANFHTFQAVSGYFRSSGYFKLRAELKDTQKIQVLIGINIDGIFRRHQQGGMLFFGDAQEAKKQYAQSVLEDIRAAGYTQEIERGILQMCDDIASERLELRVHASRNLHAKFYLCLPQNHGPNTDGWVIMGSSNLTDSGMGTTPSPRYELNVAMKDYDDVAYCKAEFDRLWAEGTPITEEDIESVRKKTHLSIEPTPFEIFMRVLIDIFGDQVEDDFSMDLPHGLLDLKYQRDAVVQGYQMLCRYNGFFLADVVGLGKTVVATMIAKRFAEANGKNTKILVVHPPAVRQNWLETFRTFGLLRKAQFVSSGSLHKVLEGLANYRAKEDFDLVIVDESHNFRNSSTNAFDRLQRICKAHRPSSGLIPGAQKKVMLLSATPLNNGPQDLLNQILLFQDARRSTIDGIPDIGGYFALHIAEYKRIMGGRQNDVDIVNAVDSLYAKIQKDVLERITIRRTRSNITGETDYAADLEAQGVSFPKVAPPNELTYYLDDNLDVLFWSTLEKLQTGIAYARYRAIEFLANPEDAARYGNAAHVAQTLAGVYKTRMVKRLESSFYAFKKSVATFLRVTNDMLSMLAQDRVLIIPDLDVTDYLEKGKSLDEILDYARNRGFESAAFPASAFREEFKELLEKDRDVLVKMQDDWSCIDYDPKFDAFRSVLKGEIFGRTLNPTGKLVVFSESVDTLVYLKDRMADALGRTDILLVTAANRDRVERDIRRSFDANAPEQADDYNILLASDVLAEGINLHRANVIVNYDTPWNAARLMQRIGRVNRIGSVAHEIRNYMFYPSKQGNAAIGLYQNSIIKLQGFHSALGEDAKVFSHEEMLRTFTLFDANVKDSVDEQLRYLRIARKFMAENPDAYKRIKALPMKCRAARSGVRGETVVYLASGNQRSFYVVSEGRAVDTSYLDALKLLEAPRSERGAKWTRDAIARNYVEVNAALAAYGAGAQSQAAEIAPATVSGSKAAQSAQRFLRDCRRWCAQGGLPEDIATVVDALSLAVGDGTFVKLEKAVSDMAKTYRTILSPDSSQQQAIAERLKELRDLYCARSGGPAPRHHHQRNIHGRAMKTYSATDFRLAFQQRFKPETWQDWLVNLFGASLIRQKPEPVKLPPSEKEEGTQGFLLGELTTSDGVRIGLFRYTVPAAQIERRRVVLNNLVKPWIKYAFDAALVVFDANDTNKWRFSLVADMRGDKTSPKRYTYVFGDSLSRYRTAVERCMKVQDARAQAGVDKPVAFAALKEAFAVETLTKEFYNELFNWYLWALSPEAAVTFPNDISTDADDRSKLEERLIYLITRLMFVWFIRRKKLVPEELFDENRLTAWLKDFDPHSMERGNYYNAILQNLFFATLNNEIPARAFATDTRGYHGRAEDYGIKTLFRNPKGGTWFKRPDAEVLNLFREVPFLNGGLFECLDKADQRDKKGRVIYRDGFSREAGRQRRAFIPNELFFGEEAPRTFTVAGAQTTRTVSGLLKILGRYNFTIEENAPDDMEVALDPELLGKVFENLLGTFNPETRETARKASGSFYTPREIVGYMVESALDAYMQPAAGKSDKEQLERLLKIRVLDPACGSGAFPMGMLGAIVARAQQLGATGDLHALKLHVIENCIFGVDIQTIAVQIAKLRCFISLVCEEQPNLSDAENNYGISPLPNLETKFVAANSLIEKKKQQERGQLEIDFEDPQIRQLKDKLASIRHRHFSARTRKDKLALRKEDEKTRNDLVALLAAGDLYAAADARQLVGWNPYAQNESADFFDPEWMFDVKEGFDVVIGNPPYKQVPKGMYSASKFPYSEGKDKGKQNLYKIFVEHGWNMVNSGGIVSIIVQSSLMCDMTAKFTRDLLLSKSEIQYVIEFPKNAPTPAGKVFKSVLQGTCIVQFAKRIPAPEHSFAISIRNDISTVHDFLFERVRQRQIKLF